jgi:hypothetical protein
MNSLKKKVIIGVNDNEDYLQFWDLQKKIWAKTDWKLKIIYVGEKDVYNKLDKTGIETVYLENPENIKTSYYIQTVTHLSRILEDDDVICYHCDMDQILVNKYKLLEDSNLINLNYNTLIHGSICFDNSSYCKNNMNSNSIMSMHNIAFGKTWKNIYAHLNLKSLDDIINYSIKNYPPNFQIRNNSSGWGIEQCLLRASVNNWLKMDQKNNIKFYSMYDLNEGWLHRKASMKNPTFNMYDSVNHKIISNNIIEYIKNNKHITWLHPYLGQFYKNKEEVNNKIKNEIILPLLNYI